MLSLLFVALASAKHQMYVDFDAMDDSVSGTGYAYLDKASFDFADLPAEETHSGYIDHDDYSDKTEEEKEYGYIDFEANDESYPFGDDVALEENEAYADFDEPEENSLLVTAGLTALAIGAILYGGGTKAGALSPPEYAKAGDPG